MANEKLSAMAAGAGGRSTASAREPLPRVMSYVETVRLIAERPEIFDAAELEECQQRVRAHRGK